MPAKMLINADDPEECRIAVIRDGILDEFHIQTIGSDTRIGNIYLATVEKADPGLQAFFINFGIPKKGFLPASEVHPDYYRDTFTTEGDLPVEEMLKKGQTVLVQVMKEMPGKKGDQLTTYISLAGRYLVLTPGNPSCGISKKIQDEDERQRLKKVTSELPIPPGYGIIVRTAAEGVGKRELLRDLNRLIRLWEAIRERAMNSQAPCLIHREQDFVLKTLRDYLSQDIGEIVVDDKEAFQRIRAYMKVISPKKRNIVRLFKEDRPIFERYGVEEQIEAIFRREVILPSGGYIVIEPTEGLITIDVNSGKGKGTKGLEDTAYRTNMEAAKEILRQLRLRDLGGLVVVDFIDMKNPKHIRDVERLLREESKKDKAKIKIGNISKFGILELSRERLGPQIESLLYEPCSMCGGRGLTPSVESTALNVLRQIRSKLRSKGLMAIEAKVPVKVADYLQNTKRRKIADLEDRYGLSILIRGEEGLGPGQVIVSAIEDTEGD